MFYMKKLNSSVTINIDIVNTELMLEINVTCTELSLSLEQFITYAINKLLYDIKFVHNLKFVNNDIQ
ncbi:Hypothetical protein CKL_2929 [Clostridium kluyveri DSM 555]|uniref:Uncharacterized protein n=2 Tax=Clostridium kluyveri TaxID=1534 RepID=A5N1E2_CLOK5|nr:Hypothetical protein CKL_2929 [Clostridium kluyveri DSM 555]